MSKHRFSLDESFPARSAGARLRQPVVIVVEQGPLSLMVLNAALVDAGFEVIATTSIDEALALAKFGPAQPDAIQPDAIQPDAAQPDAMVINIDGSGSDRDPITLARLARRRWPDLALLMASNATDPAASGMPDGTHVLPAPIVIEDLVSNLQDMLATRRPLIACVAQDRRHLVH